MSGKARILVIDDDPTVLERALQLLREGGYEVLTATNGQEGLRTVFQERPDLIILDIMMPPGMDGFEICQRVRELTDVPIVMLTARKDEEDIIRGLELGADDYVVKPFRSGELLARVKAALRRFNISPSTSPEADGYQDEWLYIDIPGRVVRVNDQRVRLSATEFNLLSIMLKNADQVLESSQILKHVWGPEYRDEVAYVRVYISHLRQKIEPDPANPVYIHTEHQVGYRFSRQD